MSTQPSTSTYISDHSAAVLNTHGQRTAQNSCAYLLPHLHPTDKILDVGCGPGSITISLAALVPSGHVTGIEYTSVPLPSARSLAASQNITNCTFVEGDIHTLPFPSNTFDIVHAHQVLQHIPDPVQGLREIRRVCKPGGLVAVRESAQLTIYPETETLKRWRKLYDEVARAKGGNPHSGARIHVWAKQAGFESVKCSAGSWCFRTEEERRVWGGGFAERCGEGGAFFENAVGGGFAGREEVEGMERAFREWVVDEDGWFGVLHGEIICRK